MKSSLIFFTASILVPFLTLIGLSVVGAFTIMTVLGITAILAVDYAYMPRLTAVRVPPTSASPIAPSRARVEAHALAA